jgi:hypothetical protein
VRVAWEAYSATWNLDTNSAFALGPRKTMENLHRVGRSQDFPDANTSSQQSGINYANPNVSLYIAVGLYATVHIFVLRSILYAYLGWTTNNCI